MKPLCRKGKVASPKELYPEVLVSVYLHKLPFFFDVDFKRGGNI